MDTNISPYHVFPDFTDLIERLERIRPVVCADYHQLKKDFPSWTDNDARVTAFGRLVNLIDSTNLSFIFLSKHLLPLDNLWWSEVHKPPSNGFKDCDKSHTANTFNNGFIKVAFVQNLFSILDSTFRLLLRAIDPGVANNGTEDFKAVYRALKTRTTSFPTNSDELIDLMHLVRNSIHNNGVYFYKTGNNEQAPYKGVPYNFYHGQAIDFVTWEWLIERLDDVRQLLLCVVRDQAVTDIANEIVDPFNVN